MMTVFVITIIITVAVWWFVQRPEFGALASGPRLEKIRQSPHFRNGRFENISNTPDLTEGETYFGVMKKFLFSKKLRNKPVDTIPALKTDLLSLDPGEDILVWFGHSSYFMQV